GIEQITEISEEFYWYDFDAFGDFSYYAGIGSEGRKVPFVRMTLFANEPVKLKAEIIFENVSEFEIGCIGVRNPLFGFDIICTEKYGYADNKRYNIRSLEDDDISFFCETFRVMSVEAAPNAVKIASPAARSTAEEYTAEETNADENTSENQTEAMTMDEYADQEDALRERYHRDDLPVGILGLMAAADDEN
ncbi:MAG: hypothetical protein ACI4Q6_07525, partial [Huintestinicola sp.]